jgi:hypothetical protein
MTRRSVAILAFVAVLGISAFAAADSMRPTPRQEKAWLQGQLAQYKRDVAAWDVERNAFDANTIRPLRHRFRSLLVPIVNETRGQARRDARHALRVLAAPGPAYSVAKRLHTRTRKFGDDALHLLNQHIGDVKRRLTLYP